MQQELEHIRRPVVQELAIFDARYSEILRSKVGHLSNITAQILSQRGKQIRPLLVLLSARLFGPVTERAYIGAALIELLHNATLIHDDIVDEADERRGIPSLHTLWGNKSAVLAGDFLLSKGLSLAVDTGSYDLLGNGCRSVQELIEGEMLQEEASQHLTMTEPLYFEIIRKKTATLFANCAENGAIAAEADESQTADLRLFGECLGMAFQIRDDIFDFRPKGDIGKPTGNDIREKKITLPLIFALSRTNEPIRSSLLSKIRENHPDAVKAAWELVEAEGGISYAEQVMAGYQERALTLLDKMPPSEAREALRHLTIFIASRNI